MLASGRVVPAASGGAALALQVSPETALVVRALTEHASECKLVNVAAEAVGSSRASAFAPARIEFSVPDEVVQNLRGMNEPRGLLLALWIPGPVKEELLRQVVTPAEAAASDGLPLIVVP